MKNDTCSNHLLAVIPARGGSKGLPGKNIRTFAGLPLIAHSIRMALATPCIDHIIVSTDDDKIAAVAKEHGADVPFCRPVELAQDTTPMWPVLRHALQEMSRIGKSYEYLLLLDPTSPGRFPEDVEKAMAKLKLTKEADGIIGVSEPEFNPIWHCVTEEKGWLTPLVSGGGNYGRRQDVPSVYRINASLYIWRCEFILRCESNWLNEGKHLLQEIPESRAIHIDTLEEFQWAELKVKERMIQFPWLT